MRDRPQCREMLDRFNGSVREFMSPQGFGGANGIFALHTRLYMERFGATREDFGRFCIAQRTNALLNPNALMKKPLTLEDLFKKTKHKPSLYYLPLTPEQVLELQKKELAEKEKEENGTGSGREREG